MSSTSRQTTDLKRFDNSWYKPGGSLKRFLWYFVSALFFESAFPLSGFKVRLLRSFGARVGNGVVIKPHVRIKYPWKLSIGDYSWIGEDAWIDNLDEVRIGTNCCVSQGALLLCGNHDYTKSTFDLMTGAITLENGSWIGAKSTVCPGVTVGSHAVLAVGSVATRTLEPYSICSGNPAVKVKERVIAS
jgi:putative colanic acid biosynthesis acetyltransferase WcaF